MITIECPNCGGPAVDLRPYDLDPREHVFECKCCRAVFMRKVA